MNTTNFKDFMKQVEKRDAEIYRLVVKKKKSLSQVGEMYDITRERVRQILKDKFNYCKALDK